MSQAIALVDAGPLIAVYNKSDQYGLVGLHRNEQLLSDFDKAVLQSWLSHLAHCD